MPDPAVSRMRPFDHTRLLALKDAVVPRARELGRWARQLSERYHAGDGDLGISTKTRPGDFVTFADAEVQRRFASTLREVAPEAGLIGEEGLDEPMPGAPVWVIDPIDGTHNFVRGYPGFCVSVGLVVAGEAVLGVIYDSVDDAVYWAVKGAGAWREGVRLARAKVCSMAHALIASNVTSVTAADPLVQRTFMELARRSAGQRSSGSSCRDFCLFVAGRLDLYWQSGIRSWDAAAGIALTREAGGVVAFADEPADWVRAPTLTVFAGAAALVAEALEVWSQARSD